MRESHAIKELKRLRGDLDNEITLLDERRRALVNKMRNVDAVMVALGYKRPEDIKGPRTRRWLFRRGELQRMVCNAIRAQGPDVASKAIALAIMREMVWPTEDPELRRYLIGKVKDVRKRLDKVTAGANASRLS